jgi:hypothetical protein
VEVSLTGGSGEEKRREKREERIEEETRSEE